MPTQFLPSCATRSGMVEVDARVEHRHADGAGLDAPRGALAASIRATPVGTDSPAASGASASACTSQVGGHQGHLRVPAQRAHVRGGQLARRSPSAPACTRAGRRSRGPARARASQPLTSPLETASEPGHVIGDDVAPRVVDRGRLLGGSCRSSGAEQSAPAKTASARHGRSEESSEGSASDRRCRPKHPTALPGIRSVGTNAPAPDPCQARWPDRPAESALDR